MSAGVLIQWENNEVGLPSPPLCPTGPDGLGWQIRQRIWGERLSNCLRERGGWEGQGREGSKRVCRRVGNAHRRHRNKGLPRRDYTRGIHIVNVRVTDWIAHPSCPSLPLLLFSPCFLSNGRPPCASPPLVQWRVDRYSCEIHGSRS